MAAAGAIKNDRNWMHCVLVHLRLHVAVLTAQALAQWRHPVASSEALDVLHWAMCSASYRRICMAIEIASNLPTFFVVVDSLLPTTIAKKHSSS
jgi:hypothetical protein